MPENLENSAVATGLEKVSFHFNPKKGSAKECSNYCTIALISHASRVMLKILQVRLQQYVNQELPDVQAVFQKGKKKKKRQRNQSSNCQYQRKQENSRKTSPPTSLTTLEALTVWITTNCGKFLKRWNTRLPYLPPEKSVCRSRSNCQNQTWNNGLVPNQESSISRLYIVTLLIYLTCRVYHVKCQAG